VAYPPSAGSYHIYHRIDGELVAIGICEFTNKYFNSAYFMYKTKYSFLNLGVVGAIIELELCRKLQELWQPDLKYYHLGELVLDCPKVNYKLNYQPGQVLCPFSKEWIDFEKAKPSILKLMKL
jgi:arginyl-tRNA--protein-N-Asp/Glu arginylyltransferase